MTQIIAYCIPALVVLLTTWLIMRSFFRSEQEKRLWELKRLSQKEISPLRMRAYERLALLLERTTPEHMLVDMNLTELTPLQVQQQLLQTIRLEHDHNLSQQVYVSDEVWQLVEDAKAETIAFIISIATQMPQGCSTLDLAKELVTAYANNGDTANSKALEALKQEARALL